MEPLILALAVALVVVGAVATYLDPPKRRRGNQSRTTTYQKIAFFLDPAERAFYDALRPIAESEGLTILAKVRLADLVEARRDSSRRDRHADVLRSTHLDFVLGDLTDLTPVVAVKLDHRVERPARDRARDQLVDSICHAAGLPLVRANVRAGFAEAEVVAQVRAKVRAISRLESTLAA